MFAPSTHRTTADGRHAGHVSHRRRDARTRFALVVQTPLKPRADIPLFRDLLAQLGYRFRAHTDVARRCRMLGDDHPHHRDPAHRHADQPAETAETIPLFVLCHHYYSQLPYYGLIFTLSLGPVPEADAGMQVLSSGKLER